MHTHIHGSPHMHVSFHWYGPLGTMGMLSGDGDQPHLLLLLLLLLPLSLSPSPSVSPLLLLATASMFAQSLPLSFLISPPISIPVSALSPSLHTPMSLSRPSLSLPPSPHLKCGPIPHLIRREGVIQPHPNTLLLSLIAKKVHSNPDR